MNFEGGFFLLLGLMFILPVLYLFALLVNWIARRKLIPLWLPFVLVVVALALGSLYLDSAGTVTPVKVVDKRESINLKRNGWWSRELSVHVEYQPPDEIIPAPLTLGCGAASFDRLRVGQTVEARVLQLGRHFKFARLKDRSTFSLITNLFPNTPRGPWQQSTAVVREVAHLTKYTHRRRSDDSPLRWPYDIVQLDFTPPGRSGAVIAVDIVEAASVPNLARGDAVQISWPEDDPRSAKIVGARPGAPWANWFYIVATNLVLVAGLVVFLILIGFMRRRRKKTRKQAFINPSINNSIQN